MMPGEICIIGSLKIFEKQLSLSSRCLYGWSCPQTTHFQEIISKNMEIRGDIPPFPPPN